LSRLRKKRKREGKLHHIRLMRKGEKLVHCTALTPAAGEESYLFLSYPSTSQKRKKTEDKPESRTPCPRHELNRPGTQDEGPFRQGGNRKKKGERDFSHVRMQRGGACVLRATTEPWGILPEIAQYRCQEGKKRSPIPSASAKRGKRKRRGVRFSCFGPQAVILKKKRKKEKL